jgi:hypothetical protein
LQQRATEGAPLLPKTSRGCLSGEEKPWVNPGVEKKGYEKPYSIGWNFFEDDDTKRKALLAKRRSFT